MRIAIGGQVEKQEIEQLVKAAGGDQVNVVIKSDLEAAMLIKSGGADYYLGACHTGEAEHLPWPLLYWENRNVPPFPCLVKSRLKNRWNKRWNQE